MKQSLFIFILIFTQISLSQDPCQMWLKRQETLLDYSEGFLNDKILQDSSDVILLGEQHLHNIHRFLEEVLSAKKSESEDYNCLFIEWDQSKADELPDRFKQFQELATRQGYTPYMVDTVKDLPDWALAFQKNRLSLYENNRQQYDELLDRLNNLAIAGSIQRNLKMADRITELFQTGQCQKGVGVFGYSHIVDLYNVNNGQTIYEYLIQNGFSVKAYKLQETLTFLNDSSLGLPATYETLITDAVDIANKCLNTKSTPILTEPRYVELQNHNVWDGIFFIPQTYDDKQ